VSDTIRITVTLSTEAARRLAAIARDHSVSSGKLLASFARDLTGAPGNNGGDERDLARAWLQRVIWPNDPRISRP
jgi:hypothetical protein